MPKPVDSAFSSVDWCPGPLSDVRIRRRLHSLLWRYQARVFALLLVADAARVFYNLLLRASLVSSAVNGWLELIAFSLAGYLLWFRPRRWFATNTGLEIRSGDAVRLVPWSTITSFRAVPMTWLEVPWYPRRFEVDLANGDVLECVGRRDADEIMRAIREA